MLNEIDKAYLGGAMDADGWFCIRRVPAKPEAHRYNTTYFVFIGFCQIQEEIPRLLHKEFGGTLQLRNRQEQRRRKSNGWKPNYYWVATSQQAHNAIKVLLPFLRIKRRQAELCLELQDSINEHKSKRLKGQPKASPLANDVVTHRTKIYEELLSLHDNRTRQQSL